MDIYSEIDQGIFTCPELLTCGKISRPERKYKERAPGGTKGTYGTKGAKGLWAQGNTHKNKEHATAQKHGNLEGTIGKEDGGPQDRQNPRKQNA